MNLQELYNQYKAINPEITEDMFKQTHELYGNEYIKVINEELKKKDLTENQEANPIQENMEVEPTNFQENILPPPISSELTGIPHLQTQSDYLSQNSLELDGMENSISTELGLGIGQYSLGNELTNNINIKEEPMQPTISNEIVGNIVSPEVIQSGEIVSPTFQPQNIEQIIASPTSKGKRVEYVKKNTPNIQEAKALNEAIKKVAYGDLDITQVEDNRVKAFFESPNKKLSLKDGNTMVSFSASRLLYLGEGEDGNGLYKSKDGTIFTYKNNQLETVLNGELKVYGKDFTINKDNIVHYNDETVDTSSSQKPTKYVPAKFNTWVEDTYNVGNVDEQNRIHIRNESLGVMELKRDEYGDFVYNEDGTIAWKITDKKFYDEYVEGINKDNENLGHYEVGSVASTYQAIHDRRKVKERLEEGARKETELKNYAIEQLGNEVAKKYDYAPTEEQIEIELFNRRVSRIAKERGLTLDQARQEAQHLQEQESISKIKASANLVSAIVKIAEENDRKFGGKRVSNSQYYKFTDEERKVWNEFSQDPEFAEWYNRYGKQLFGYSNGEVGVAYDTRNRKRIAEHYLSYQYEKQNDFRDALKSTHDRRLKSEINWAIKDKDIKKLQALRRERGALTQSLKAIESRMQDISQRFGRVETGFDILYNEKVQSAEDYAGYQNGNLGSVAKVTASKIINGISNVANDFIGGVQSLAIPFSQTATAYVYNNSQNSRNYLNVLGDGISDTYEVYSKNGRTIQKRHGLIFDVGKEGNLEFNEELSNNQQSLKDWKFERKDYDINIAGIIGMITEQATKMAAISYGSSALGKIANLSKITRVASLNAERMRKLGFNPVITKAVANYTPKADDVYSAIGWGVGTLQGNITQGLEAGLTNKQAFFYGLFQSGMTMALLKVSPDEKFFGEYKGVESSVLKLIAKNNFDGAKKIFMETIKKMSRSNFGEMAQEELERNAQNLINHAYNVVMGKKEDGSERFSTGSMDEFVDTFTQTGLVTTALEAIGLFRGRDLKLEGRNKLQKTIFASQIPDFEKQYLEPLLDSGNREDGLRAIVEIEKVRKYTSQIPPDSKLHLEETERVILAMERIEELNKLKNSSINTGLNETYDKQIKENEALITSIFDRARERNNSKKREETTPKEETIQTKTDDIKADENIESENDLSDEADTKEIEVNIPNIENSIQQDLNSEESELSSSDIILQENENLTKTNDEYREDVEDDNLYTEIDTDSLELLKNARNNISNSDIIKNTSNQELPITSNTGIRKNINTDIDRANISILNTDEQRFQGRKKLNETIVNNIAENFSDKDQDPIHIWRDPKDGKYYVLSGHHRYYGAMRAGVDQLKVIDRSLDFNEQQAIRFAKEEANANRSMETPLERASTLRQKRERGDDSNDIKSFLKGEGRNKNFVHNLSFLAPRGKAIQSMQSFESSNESDSKRETERIADWIGEARRYFPNYITDSHENEMYDYLSDKNKSKRFTNKREFIEKIRSLIGLDFDINKPLNLGRISIKGDMEQEWENQKREIQNRIDEYEAKIKDLDNRFIDVKRDDYISPNTTNFTELKERARKQRAKLVSLQEIEYKKLDEHNRSKGDYLKADASMGNLFGDLAFQRDLNKPYKKGKISQGTFNKLIEKLKKHFSKAFKGGVNVTTDWDKFNRKYEEYQRDREYQKANEEFNKRLDEIEQGKLGKPLSLGMPNVILRSAGIKKGEILLEPQKILAKTKKHNYKPGDIKGLVKALQNPIAVFRGSQEGSFAILTEVEINGNRTLVSMSLGKNSYAEFNMVSSVYGKAKERIINWINKDKASYINKEKASDYLRTSAPIAVSKSSPILSYTNLQKEIEIAKSKINNFQNPMIEKDVDYQKRMILEDYMRYSDDVWEYMDDIRAEHERLWEEDGGGDTDIHFMKTSKGVIYGAKLPDGTIYLNPEELNANTPIHEFGHIWEQLMPQRFREGVKLLKGTKLGKDLFNELRANKGYKNYSDEKLWNETLVTMLGNRGEELFHSSSTSKFVQWVKYFFKAIGEYLYRMSGGIVGREITPEDKMQTFVKGALAEIMGVKEIIPESNILQSEVPLYLRELNDKQIQDMLERLNLITEAECA